MPSNNPAQRAACKTYHHYRAFIDSVVLSSWERERCLAREDFKHNALCLNCRKRIPKELRGSSKRHRANYLAQLDQRNALGVKILNGIEEDGSSTSGSSEDSGCHASTESERDGVSGHSKDSAHTNSATSEGSGQSSASGSSITDELECESQVSNDESAESEGDGVSEHEEGGIGFGGQHAER